MTYAELEFLEDKQLQWTRYTVACLVYLQYNTDFPFLLNNGFNNWYNLSQPRYSFVHYSPKYNGYCNRGESLKPLSEV